jgi:hypothetical protein
MSYDFFFRTRAALSAPNRSFDEGTMNDGPRATPKRKTEAAGKIALGASNQKTVWFGPTALRLSYGRCRMSSRMEAKTTLYILYLMRHEPYGSGTTDVALCVPSLTEISTRNLPGG